MTRQHLVESLRHEIRMMMTLSVGQTAPWLNVDLSMAQLKALMALHGRRDLRVGEIAQLLGISPNATTALLDHLEEGDLVQRRSDPHDRRAVLVTLTDSGNAWVAELLSANLGAFVEILEYLSLGELESLQDGMAAVNRALKEKLDGKSS